MQELCSFGETENAVIFFELFDDEQPIISLVIHAVVAERVQIANEPFVRILFQTHLHSCIGHIHPY